MLLLADVLEMFCVGCRFFTVSQRGVYGVTAWFHSFRAWFVVCAKVGKEVGKAWKPGSCSGRALGNACCWDNIFLAGVSLNFRINFAINVSKLGP